MIEDLQAPRLAQLGECSLGETLRALQRKEAVEGSRVMLDALTVDDPGVREVLLTAFDRVHRGLAAAVERAQDLGEIDPDISPTDVAWTLQGLGVVGLIRRAMSPDDVADGAVRAAESLLERWRPGSTSE